MILKIVSGGQTGADRAGLDWAIKNGVGHGGWCPRGRRAEDGCIPPVYLLRETEDLGYKKRTEMNVVDSDCTAIFTVERWLDGGSLLTARMATKHGKPWVHSASSEGVEAAAEKLLKLVSGRDVVLNVAGSRGSRGGDMGGFVQGVLDEIQRSCAEARRTVIPRAGKP